MKTIPVSRIVVLLLAPAFSLVQARDESKGERRREGGEPDRDGPKRPFVEFWKMVDKDHDGFISRAEFDAMPRVKNLPEEKRSNLFSRLDKDQDGKLGREEIARMGQFHDGHGVPMQRLWELDTDKSGGISLEEFKAGQFVKKLPPEKQEKLFQRLDTDGDGLITPKDKPEPPFKREGGDKRHEGERKDPRQMLRTLDKDGDGAVTFEEFRNGPMVKNLGEDEQEDRFEELDRNDDLKLTADDFPPPPSRGDSKPPENPPAAE
jgi:Ca2+-binding EF-hand superfamily protein